MEAIKDKQLLEARVQPVAEPGELEVGRLARFKITDWREGVSAPRAIVRTQADAVVGNDGVVYLRHGGTREMYAYDTVRDSWSQLPDSPTTGCSLMLVTVPWTGEADDPVCPEQAVTTIGGYDERLGYSNKLFSFLPVHGRGKKWTEALPPMPTRRYGTTALCVHRKTTLIVAGGWGEGGALDTVEVMNMESLQWSTAAKLPTPTLGSSGAICGDRVFLHGGEISKGHTKHLYTCLLTDLLQGRSLCDPQKLQNTGPIVSTDKAAEFGDIQALVATTKSVWHKTDYDLPVQISTLISFNKELLLVGGYTDCGKPASTIHRLNPLTQEWDVLGEMPFGRCYCFAAVVQDGRSQLVVAGGIVNGNPSDSVTISRFCA